MPASTVAKAEQAVTPTEFTSPCTQERFLTNAEEGATRGNLFSCVAFQSWSCCRFRHHGARDNHKRHHRGIKVCS